jgi:hypothetical protein
VLYGPDEQARRNKAPVGVLPARQDFEAVNIAGTKVYDRLKVRDKLTFFKSLMNILLGKVHFYTLGIRHSLVKEDLL